MQQSSLQHLLDRGAGKELKRTALCRPEPLDKPDKRTAERAFGPEPATSSDPASDKCTRHNSAVVLGAFLSD
jgi:hypothetical protein